MIKKHERNDLLLTASNELYDSFFRDSLNAMTKLDSLYGELQSFIDGENDEDDVFDALEELDVRISDIITVGTGFTSVNEALNKYLNRTALTLQMLIENISSLTGKGLYPAAGDVQILMSEIYDVIGGISYFLLNEFEIVETIEQLVAGEAYEIDEIFDAYVKSNSLSKEDVCNVGKMILDYNEKYKFHLEFFDEYPELELDFEKMVGPLYNVMPESALTYENVTAVIAGDLEPESLVESSVFES